MRRSSAVAASTVTGSLLERLSEASEEALRGVSFNNSENGYIGGIGGASGEMGRDCDPDIRVMMERLS